jgi:hypothetical protein
MKLRKEDWKSETPYSKAIQVICTVMFFALTVAFYFIFSQLEGMEINTQTETSGTLFIAGAKSLLIQFAPILKIFVPAIFFVLGIRNIIHSK